jgi:hypothetical protein
MSIERMRKRLAAERASFVEPCLPSPADKPPSGSNRIGEIKHDGFRLMARRGSLINTGAIGCGAFKAPSQSWRNWKRALTRVRRDL